MCIQSRQLAVTTATRAALIVFLTGGTASAGVTLDPGALGARVDETAATVNLTVNPAAAAASDANSGTEARPLRTIARAAALAMDYNRRGVGVRVQIAPGVYRESVILPGTEGDTSAPIIFEAAKGSATISGSDLWTGWRAGSPAGIYAHDWPHAWGVVPYPAGWDCCVVLPDRVRRREMIFVNGIRLSQVLSKDALRPGSFFVSEASRQVFVQPPSAVAMDDATVEVAVRSALFQVQRRTNVVIRGLSFTHDNSAIGGSSAVAVNNSTNVLIEDAVMSANNNRGLALADDERVTVRRTVANSNGFLGIAGWKLTSAVFMDSETSYNNWRGFDDGFKDWDPSGTKLMLLRDAAVIRHTLIGNLSYGLWLDTDCINVLLDSIVSTKNLNDGVFLEAVQGPISIRGSSIRGNARAGIVVGNASNVDVRSTVISDNHVAQLLISGNPDGRRFDDFRTGQRQLVQSTNWTVNGNTISAGLGDQVLVSTTLPASNWQSFVDSLSSDENAWGLPVDRRGFRWVNGVKIDCPTWRELTGQDRRSDCFDPLAAPRGLRIVPNP